MTQEGDEDRRGEELSHTLVPCVGLIFLVFLEYFKQLKVMHENKLLWVRGGEREERER